MCASKWLLRIMFLTSFSQGRWDRNEKEENFFLIVKPFHGFLIEVWVTGCVPLGEFKDRLSSAWPGMF